MKNNTTHPQGRDSLDLKKYTWLFLGTPKGEEWTGLPVTLRTIAETEEEARDTYPTWNLTFAAKIRTESPLNTTWGDSDSATLWTLCGTDTSCLHDMAGLRHD